MSFTDLTGKDFGRLHVVSRTEDHVTVSGKHMVMWFCQCSCGKTLKVLSANLKSGNTVSCGCYREELRPSIITNKSFVDLSGSVINNYYVVSLADPYIDPKNGNKHHRYLCRCTLCGRERVCRADILKRGCAVCPCSYKKRGRRCLMSRVKDLTGQVFGKLTVVERDMSSKKNTRWICRCSCGNMKSILASNLIQGQTKSCGCDWRAGRPQLVIEPGTRYGMLTVIKSLGARDVSYGDGDVTRRQFVLAKCDCGNITEVSALSLRHVKSCGCRKYRLKK